MAWIPRMSRPKQPKQVEVNLNPETKKVIVEHNRISEEEIELQQESLKIEKEKLKVKDRVEISLSEYNKMKDELEYLSKIKNAYFNLINPVIKSSNISVEVKKLICDGKINFAKFLATPDFDPCNMKTVIKVALYFTVEEDRL